MKRAQQIVITLVIICSIIWWLAKRDVVPKQWPARTSPAIQVSEKVSSLSNTPPPTSISDLPERDRTAINILKGIYTASISVYGRVEDEKGNPIAAATVEYSLNDKYFKDGTPGRTKSDSQGGFTIKGSGMSVYVDVEKQGYYRIPNRSYDSIRANQETSLKAPAVFVLKKAGVPQLLVYNEIDRERVQITGAPTEIDLSHRKRVPAGQGHLRVEVWVDGPPQGHPYNNFPWHCRVSVPGGGMVERNDELAFEAPADGYLPAFEVTMKPGEQWGDDVDRNLYLRLPDQTYARGRLFVSIDRDHASVSFNSYWNQTGSRNLEAGANDFGQAK